MESHAGRERGVIDEQKAVLPVFSAKGVRWDVLVVTVTLLVLVFAGVLFADLEALYSGGDRIGKLSAGIESLESSNSLLREQLSIALNHPVLRNQAAEAGAEGNVLVIRSTIPEK